MHSISFTFFKKYKNELFHLQNFKYLPDDFPWHDHRIARWFDEPSLQHGLSLGCHSTCLYIIPSVPVVFWTLICLLRILPYFLTGVWEEEKMAHVMDIREMWKGVKLYLILFVKNKVQNELMSFVLFPKMESIYVNELFRCLVRISVQLFLTCGLWDLSWVCRKW